MSTNDPDQIRREIAETRGDLSRNVNALGEAVQPSSIAKRQAEKVTGAAVGIKDKIMGSAEDARYSVSDSASGVGDRAGDAVGSAKRRTQGNPLAAGLIALGAGWLLGSILPSSEKERQAAVAVKEKAEPALEEAKAVAQDSAQHLKEPAQQAAQQVKDSAQGAVETVKAEGQQVGQDVKASAEDSRATVQQHQQRPDTSV